MRVVPKEWGHECIITNNELYCLKILVCEDRIWSSKGKFHYHRVKDETFLVIEGLLELDTVDERGIITNRLLREAESIRILPGSKHRFRSYGRRCRFIEASTQHFDGDSVRTEYVVKDKVGIWIDDLEITIPGVPGAE